MKVTGADSGTPAPVACAGCGGQYVDRRHVDFEAAWDGPVLNALEVVTEGITVSQVDDLVVCETCLRDAFRLLEFNALSDDERMDLTVENARLRAQNAGQARYIEQLERTVAAKPPERRAPSTRAPRKQKAAA